MKAITVLLLSLVLAIPMRAHAGHWVIEESENLYTVEYIQDLTDKVPGPKLAKEVERLQQPATQASKESAAAGQRNPTEAARDPQVAEAQKQYVEKRNAERLARQQERAAQRQERETRRQEREAARR